MSLTDAARWLAPRWLVALGVCLATGWIGLTVFGVTGPGRSTPDFAAWPLLDMWMRWDAGWYRGIAVDGYYFSATEQSSVAFFPLYPLLMAGLVRLGVNPFLAGVGWTLVFGFCALTLFLRWAARLTSWNDARRAVYLLLTWPFAYYLLGAVYSDALFLCCVVGAFVCLEEERPVWAALLGALATATRPVAPAVVLGLLARQLELRRQKGQPWGIRDIVPAGSALGLASYMAFLAVRFGDPIAFVTTQRGWRQLTGPQSLLKISELAKVRSSWDLALPLFHAALALSLLALGVLVWRRLGLGYGVFIGVVLGMPLLSSRDFIGLGRYALAAFPCFLGLSLWWDPRLRGLRLYFVLSAAMLVWMTARFALGRYVA